MRRVMIVVAVLLFATPAIAGPTVEEFLNMKSKDLTTVYMDGLLEGFNWYAGLLRQAGGREIYCPPPKIAITRDQALDILRRYVRQHPMLKNSTVGLVMGMAFMDAFPCK
jgi:hypothetical protein